jgi:hypothetical protein
MGSGTDSSHKMFASQATCKGGGAALGVSGSLPDADGGGGKAEHRASGLQAIRGRCRRPP